VVISIEYTEGEFVFKLLLSLGAGFLVGMERESRGKKAGISTQTFVIAGAMLFTMMSLMIDPNEPARVAAQIVTGIGFLGAGIILKDKTGNITNLTTAASIWFSAAIGMTIGIGYYMIAILATLFSILVPRIPHFFGSPDHHDK